MVSCIGVFCVAATSRSVRSLSALAGNRNLPGAIPSHFDCVEGLIKYTIFVFSEVPRWQPVLAGLFYFCRS